MNRMPNRVVKTNPYEPPKTLHTSRGDRVPMWRHPTFGFYLFAMASMSVIAAIIWLIVQLV
jgi:hypothetical protein